MHSTYWDCSDIGNLRCIVVTGNRRGIAPPEIAEPEKTEAGTILRSVEPRYFAYFNGPGTDSSLA